MTSFQLVMAAVFAVVTAVTYRKQLMAFVGGVVRKQSGLDVKASIAVTIVHDLLSVTQLRDKLAAEDCPEGVDACTNLLRVIVEQTKPTKAEG
jgi:hypothetical protein